METPRKFITEKLSTHELGTSTVVIIITDEDPSLRIKSFGDDKLKWCFQKIIF